MALLLMYVRGFGLVQAVRLDDPSPDYAAEYVQTIRKDLTSRGIDAGLRHALVDVTSVAECGPNDVVAQMLGDERTDLPQIWETA